MEKKHKTLGTEKCEKSDTLYINKMAIIGKRSLGRPSVDGRTILERVLMK